MNFKLSTGSLARGSGRHPWITIAVWVIALLSAVFISANLLGDALVVDARPTDEPESWRGHTLLKERLPGYDKAKETIVVDSKNLKVNDPAYKDFVNTLSGKITKLDKNIVEGAVSYYQTGDRSLVSADGHTTILPVVMAGTMDNAIENIGRVHKAIEEADKDSRFKVRIVGPATMNTDFKEVSEKDLRTGEFYGILAALVILILVFATLVSAAIPLILAIGAIIAAVGATALLGQAFDFSFFIVNMITMMGLAVGIDYSLFIVSRYREERKKGVEVIDAIANTGATASRAVFFSGMTVILALLGLLIVPHTIFRSLAIGAILVVIFAVLASLTLLPAVLSLLGDRVNALRIPLLGRRLTKKETEDKGGFWNWTTRKVLHHPVISLVLTTGLLVAFALPVLNINIGSSMGPDALPDGLQSRKAYQILVDKFSAGQMTQAQIVVDGKVSSASVQKSIEKLRKELASDGDFGPSALIVNPQQNLALLNAPVARSSNYDKTSKAIDKLRDEYIPKAFPDSSAKVLVTGDTASSKDFTKTVEDYMPIIFALVLGLSFLLLTVVFRSLVVPIKAIIMNLLSVGAAYGLMVLVFQKGYGAHFLGFQQVDVIESWIPLFLFSVLFGLSMDYHVFLLSRIREHFNQTNDNSASVAFGLSSTGRIITGAAVIMVAVFAGFAAGDLLMFQQLGFGLAVAVFLDATIIRTILVPASMKLLGKANWYLPKLLQWLPDVHVEGVNSDSIKATSD